jgi:hypothetical protein
MICRLLVKEVSHLLGSFFVSSSLQSYSGVAMCVLTYCLLDPSQLYLSRCIFLLYILGSDLMENVSIA